MLRGSLNAEQLRAAADLADRFADGELRTTVMQNLLIVNVPRKAPALRSELQTSACTVEARRSGVEPSPARAPSSASWRSPKRKALRAGWSKNSKAVCRASISSSSSISLAAPTVAASTGLPILDWKARRLRWMATCRRLLLLRRRLGRTRAGDCPPSRISLPGHRGSRCHRAPALPLCRMARRRRELCRVLRTQVNEEIRSPSCRHCTGAPRSSSAISQPLPSRTEWRAKWPHSFPSS